MTDPNNENTWAPRAFDRPVPLPDRTGGIQIRERFVLNDKAGTTVFRRRGFVPEALHAGDLMHDFMEPLAHEIMEARKDDDHPLCVHGTTEEGRPGQFIIPLDSIAYATVEMIDDTGDLVTAQPGYLHEIEDEPETSHAPVTHIGKRHIVAKNLRRNDPTQS
jgi:hypothetical protein